MTEFLAEMDAFEEVEGNLADFMSEEETGADEEEATGDEFLDKIKLDNDDDSKLDDESNEDEEEGEELEEKGEGRT